jgi:Tol biopolymer transport system component
VSSRGAQANAPSYGAVVSANGRWVAFTSTASNLVRHDGNGHADVFVRDLRRGTTRRVSVAGDGHGGNAPSVVDAISANGRLVLFRSSAANLVPHDRNRRTDVFLANVVRRTIRRVSAPGGREGLADAGRGLDVARRPLHRLP